MATADVAAYFGVTRQRVGQIRREEGSFPRSQLELDGGPIWIREGIEIWAAAHRPEALKDASPLVPHGARILLEAESIAAEMRHGYVGSSTLWLAMRSIDHSIDAVLASMGATRVILGNAVARAEPPRDEPPRGAPMNPRAQQLLAKAAAAARDRGTDVMEPMDLAIAMVDADAAENDGRGRRDLLLAVIESRGGAIDELRRRLVAAQADPTAVDDFEPRRLARRPRRVDPRRKVIGDLLPNGLGHDPWARQPWGTGFAVRKDGRRLKVDGQQWFFTMDRDGFYVRTISGRPVGYRWQIEPTPAAEPVNGELEVLPMPPDDVAYWPDYRHPRD